MRVFLTAFTWVMLGCTTLTAYGPKVCCENYHPFDGFYAGIAGGIALQGAEDKLFTNARYNTFFGIENLNTTRHLNIYRLRPWGEIFGGWGRQCACLYWGGRLGVNFSKFNPELRTNTSKIDPADEGNAILINTLRTRTQCAEFTFDFKPGWNFCSQSMLYGIIGGALNKEKLVAKSQFTEFPPGPSSFSDIQLHKQKTSVGLHVGIGLEHMLSRCWSLQLAYAYTRYWKLHRSIVQTVGTTVHTVDFSTRASKQVTSIGLAYYF